MKKTIRLNKISLAALLNNHKLRAYELMSTHMHRNGCWSLNTTHYHLSRKSLGLKIAPHAYRSTTRKKKDNNYLAEQHAFTWSISINVWPYGWRINKFVTAIEWTSSNSKRIKSENKKKHTHTTTSTQINTWKQLDTLLWMGFAITIYPIHYSFGFLTVIKLSWHIILPATQYFPLPAPF